MRCRAALLCFVIVGCEKDRSSKDAAIEAEIDRLVVGDATARFSASYALEQRGREAVPALLKAFESRSRERAAAVLCVLWNITQNWITDRSDVIDRLDRERVESLLIDAVLTDDGGTLLAASAAHALNAYGTSSAVPRLLEGLDAEAVRVRSEVCGALGFLGSKAIAAESRLVSRLKVEEVSTVRREILLALRRIKARSAATARASAERLGDQDPHVRMMATEVLLAMGDHAKPAKDLIEAALPALDADEEVDGLGDLLRELLASWE